MDLAHADRDPNPARGPQASSLTAEERRLLAECSREALWYRSLPLAVATGATAAVAAHRNVLATSVRYGHWPRTLFAAAVGYTYACERL